MVILSCWRFSSCFQLVVEALSECGTGLPVSVAALAVRQKLWNAQALVAWHVASVAVGQKLRDPEACGVFPDQG